MNQEILIKEIEMIKDPTLNQTLKESSGIKSLSVSEDFIVSVEVYVKNPKKDGSQVRLEIIKCVKMKLNYPGVKVDILDFPLSLKEEVIYIGIISGKGGVGKSTVTVQLAHAFHTLGYGVGIIDADIHGASIPSILEMNDTEVTRTEDEKLIPMEAFGIEVISTAFFMNKEKPLMWRGPMLGKMLIHYFNDVKWSNNTKIVFIDFPPGTGDVALDIQSFAPKTTMIVVTTPHPNASMVAVKAGLGAKQLGHEVIGVIENMSYYIEATSKDHIPIFGMGGGARVALMLGVDVYAQIPLYNGESFFDLEGHIHHMYVEVAKKIEQRLKRSQIVK
jgi:ATP-binding protein involved in chromosome partitioning